MKYPIRQLLLALAVLGAARPIHAASFSPEAASPARYDVVWNSPSKDQNGSMPLGNGSIGINAWIEPGNWGQGAFSFILIPASFCPFL